MLCCVVCFNVCSFFCGLEFRCTLMFNLYDDNLLFRYLMTDKCENFTFFIVVTAAAVDVAVTVVVVVADVDVFPVHYLFCFSLYASVKHAFRALSFLTVHEH